MPVRERAMALAKALKNNGNQVMDGDPGLAFCIDQILRGDGASFEERLRARALLSIEIMQRRGDIGIEKYSLDRIMKELRPDFEKQVSEFDAAVDRGETEGIDTTPYDFSKMSTTAGDTRKLLILALIVVPILIALFSH